MKVYTGPSNFKYHWPCQQRMTKLNTKTPLTRSTEDLGSTEDPGSTQDPNCIVNQGL